MKKPKRTKLDIVKSSDLRVYKDNARPTVFKDKRKQEKYKNKWEEEAYEEIISD